MQEVDFTYVSENLIELFHKEAEVIHNITPYCLETDKEVTTRYSISSQPPLYFKLVIKVIKHESKRGSNNT